MPALTISGLGMRFGAVDVLKQIDMSIDDGEFVVLVGPSGCGKSTLLNIIAGLETPTHGTLTIGGRDVARVAPQDRDIAMVFQSYALYPAMTVRQNIAFGMECRRVPKVEREAAIARVAGLLQIGHLLERRPSQLSGGQRQRVAMGRALVRNPILFLFDEPLSNLDAKLRLEMRMEIKRLHQRVGTTSVYVTHDQVEAMTLATRVAVMYGGQIQQFDEPQIIYDAPANLFVARFMGSPPMNTVPARVDCRSTGAVALLDRAGNDTIELPLPHAPAAIEPWLGRELLLGIRPECITEPGRHAEPTALMARIQATVDLVEPTGAENMILLRFGAGTALARTDPRMRPPTGSVAEFAIDMSKACLFDPATEVRIT